MEQTNIFSSSVSVGCSGRLWRPVLFLLCSLLWTFFLYAPGLPGPFVFDDFPNLSPLGEYSHLDYWSRLLLYISSSDSGPTGRPVSLLTFFLNQSSWPSDPYSFKFTNLMIHLLNGVLVFWFVFKLLSKTNCRQKCAWVAAIVSLLWLVHPLNVTPVLYVVQRMTELSGLFTLLGLIAYLYGREKAIRDPVGGYLFMTLALGIFGLLAVLSKENGALLLAYVLVTEYLLLRVVQRDVPKGYGLWCCIVLVVPLVLLLSYMLYPVLWAGAYGARDFTVGERLLTESRVLVSYLKQLVIPEIGGSGLFHDDYQVSRGVLDPPVTLISMVAVFLLVGVSFFRRTQRLFISFAIAWFFAGQLMESTVVALEIYFEHRNYLPILGFVFAGVISPFRVEGWTRTVVVVFIVLLFLYFSFVVHTNAQLWGGAARATLVWASEHPASIRAQSAAIDRLVLLGRSEEARKHLMKLSRHHPDSGMVIMKQLNFDCKNGYLNSRSFEELLSRLRTSSFSVGVLDEIKSAASLADAGVCVTLNNNSIMRVFAALDENTAFQDRSARQVVSYFRGVTYGRLGKLDSAIESLSNAFEAGPDLDIRLMQAAYLSSAGLYADALEFVISGREEVRNSGGYLIERMRSDELDALEKTLLEQAERNRKVMQ